MPCLLSGSFSSCVGRCAAVTSCTLRWWFHQAFHDTKNRYKEPLLRQHKLLYPHHGANTSTSVCNNLPQQERQNSAYCKETSEALKQIKVAKIEGPCFREKEAAMLLQMASCASGLQSASQRDAVALTPTHSENWLITAIADSCTVLP